MRYSLDHKDRTRALLLKEAAEQMRLHGPNGISLAEIMARVGLTHGGFYAHFKSKDELIAAAIREMFLHAGKRRALSLAETVPLEAFIDLYVASSHRDSPALGCPIPALMSESGRWPQSARKAFDEGVAALAERLAKLMPPRVKDARAAAMSLIAEMAGAIALSRAIGDRTLSDALLSSSRKALKSRFAAAPARVKVS